jgi:hypothetical protein
MDMISLKEEVNPKLYELLELPEVKSLTSFIETLADKSEAPILVECGLRFMHKYFA